jgi:uncharacterized repeat protein (TIGR03803 family)
MKTHLQKLFLLPTLIIGLNLIVAGPLMAQNFTLLYNFTNVIDESMGPAAGLVLSGNTLYGTTYWSGSVFAINTDGTGYRILYNFTNYYRDGMYPMAPLTLSGNTLYGTVSQGGMNSAGAVFAINTDGTGFTNLYSFTGTYGGWSPNPRLILSGNTIYGTMQDGGTNGTGFIFAINTDGTGFTDLYDFTGTPPRTITNSDGVDPDPGLVLSGNTLYGTTHGGGSSGSGTVFAINTDGTGFTNLYNFTATQGVVPSSGEGANSDGACPMGPLILSGNTLYGTTAGGGMGGVGTVFTINTDGTGFTNLHNFTWILDGTPRGGLVLSGNTLYGTAAAGVTIGNDASVFAVHTDGTGFTNLFVFPIYCEANAGIILSGNTFYGTAPSGYENGAGRVFSLSFAPQLTIIPSETNVILSWPTNNLGFDFTSFTLQSTPDLTPPALWTTASPAPVVVNGQNTVTNPISGTQMFYRLNQ